MIRLSDWVDITIAEEYGLTPRQLHVLAGIAKGLTNAQIGRHLYLSEDTIKTHAKALYLRLGASDRASAVAMAYDFGIFRTRAARVDRATELQASMTKERAA